MTQTRSLAETRRRMAASAEELKLIDNENNVLQLKKTVAEQAYMIDQLTAEVKKYRAKNRTESKNNKFILDIGVELGKTKLEAESAQSQIDLLNDEIA